MNFKKKGEMAMGTLIIFIAMILIAAVAAAVLITTTSSLQTKALETGKATKSEVGTNIQVLQIYGGDASSANQITNMTVLVKLAPGSDMVRLKDLLVNFGLKDGTTPYSYADKDCATGASTSEFGADYSINGSSHVDKYLTPGDVAKLCFTATRDVNESESYQVQLIPKVGTPTTISSITPDVMNKATEYLFP